MNFTDYFRSIEPRELKRSIRNKISAECDIQQPTFYLWLRTNKYPSLAKQKIAEILKMPLSELFPENETINI